MSFNLLLAAANSATAMTEEQQKLFSTVYFIGTVVMLIVVFYFFILRPQKKKEKETKELRDSLQVGDEVTTIGGITGIIVRLNKNPDNSKDDTAVIETGGDRSKIRVKLWAISENATIHDAVEEAPKKK